jgi:hypothetical protein
LCAGAEGYRDYDEPRDITEARKKKYGFDSKRGFKGETGCKLPMHERSHVCLGFICSGKGPEKVPPWGYGLHPPVGVNKPFTEAQYERTVYMRDLMFDKANVRVHYVGDIEITEGA